MIINLTLNKHDFQKRIIALVMNSNLSRKQEVILTEKNSAKIWMS